MHFYQYIFNQYILKKFYCIVYIEHSSVWALFSGVQAYLTDTGPEVQFVSPVWELERKVQPYHGGFHGQKVWFLSLIQNTYIISVILFIL